MERIQRRGIPFRDEAGGQDCPPCFTVIIYYGEEDWTGPRSLTDMANIPELLQPWFQDYRMHLLCVRDEDGSSFTQKDVKDLFYVLNCFYHGREQEIKEQDIFVSPETYQAIAAVQKNKKRLGSISGKKKGEISMCSALERIWENGKKEGIQTGMQTGIQQEKRMAIERLLNQNILTFEQIAQVMEVGLGRVQEVRRQLEI